MTDEATKNPALQAWFAEATQPLDDETFTAAVMHKANRAWRWKIARRVVLGITLGLIAIPAQDIGLIIAQGLLVQLVDIPNSLAALVLAPINSVGGVLSIVLLMLRTMQRRLFA